MIAISGLNIALVAGSLYLLLIVSGVRQGLAAFLALIMAVIQTLIAGGGIPIQRAAWMSGAGFLALILNRERDSLNTFFMAFFILLLCNPASLANVSFQLSFLSVFSLILVFKRMNPKNVWAEYFANSFAVIAGTFPLVLYHFNIFSPASLFANLGAIPFFHLALLAAIATLIFSPIFFVAKIFAVVATFFLNAGTWWIHLWTLVPGGYIFSTTPPIWKLLLYYTLLALGGLVSAFSFRAQKAIFAVIISLWLGAAASFFYHAPKPGLEITLFSAGKNEIAYVGIDSRTHLLINTGCDFPSNQAEWLVASFLKRKKIKRLDAIVLQDGYKKHRGGLEFLMRNFKVRNLWVPRQIFLPKKSVRMNSEQTLPLKNAEIQILKSAANLIFLLRYDRKQILFLPDLKSETLEFLAAQPETWKEIDLLMLPVLGNAETPQLDALLDLVAPEQIATPSSTPEARESLKLRNTPILESYGGAVTFSFLPAGKMQAEIFKA